MHELGHAIGLNHEHQRNDREKFVTFVCENVEGYEEAKKTVNIDEKAYFEDDDSVDLRMRLTCNDDEIASDYFPAAVAFIRPKDHRIPDEKDKWKAYTRSEQFHYNSIMITTAMPTSLLIPMERSRRIGLSKERMAVDQSGKAGMSVRRRRRLPKVMSHGLRSCSRNLMNRAKMQ